jgi:ribosome-associated protein
MENMESQLNQPKSVPESEIEEKFVRGGGPGGQNVNKLATKVELRWNIDTSAAFSPEEKGKIKEALKNRVNKLGELVITSQEERAQAQNRERAMEVLQTLVAQALIPEKERVPTKPTKGSKERRLQEKREQGEKRKERGWKPEE